MRVRWLGWAGLELTADSGDAVVIDALKDADAVFTPLGLSSEEVRAPAITAAHANRSAVAGLITHLHRDHADAEALSEALAPRAPVFGPPAPSGEHLENLALAGAAQELAAAALDPIPTEPWSSRHAGAFTLTALPAVDGTGDPQVSWLIEADGRRVVHLGDTMMHGYWWRIAQRHGPFDLVAVPVNGARVFFPHRQPPTGHPVVLDPDQAVAAATALAAPLAAPIHFGGYEIPGLYESVSEAEQRFSNAASATAGLTVRQLDLGEELVLGDSAPR